MKSKASSKASAPKSGPKSATYYDMIKSAISDLADRTGSLLQAISKYIASSKPDFNAAALNRALKSGVKSGKLTQVKASFKLSASEKKLKSTKKKTITKTATAKKTTTKKKPTTKSVYCNEEIFRKENDEC